MGPLIVACQEYEEAEDWDRLAWFLERCSTTEIEYLNRYDIKSIKGHRIAYRILHMRCDGVFKCNDGLFRRFPSRLGYPQFRPKIKARVAEARRLAFPPPPPQLATAPAVHV